MRAIPGWWGSSLVVLAVLGGACTRPQPGSPPPGPPAGQTEPRVAVPGELEDASTAPSGLEREESGVAEAFPPDDAPAPDNEPAAGLGPLIDAAKLDLARRLGNDVAQIALVSAEARVWPDASLGCPQPGRFYAQVLREGALIRLRALDRAYAYHSGGGRAPFLCEEDAPPSAGRRGQSFTR